MACQLRQQHAGLPRPASMLFDLEIEEINSTPMQLDAEAEQAVHAVSLSVSRAFSAASQVVRDVEAACQTLLAQGGRVCTAGLAQVLSALGYVVHLRESLGGGAGGQCLRNLRHSCLVLEPQEQSKTNSGNHSNSIIVDPTFRDQFAIAHPSPRYAAVLDALPAVYVGPTSKIPPLVELLCAEMSLAFHSMGIVLPPWRYTKSMLTKWQPRRSVDLNVQTAGSHTDIAAGRAATAVASCKQQAAAAASATAASVAVAGGYIGGGISLLQDCRFNGSNISTATNLVSSGSSSSSGNSEQQQQPDCSQLSALECCPISSQAAPFAITVDATEAQQLPQLLHDMRHICGAPLLAEAMPIKQQTSFEPLQRVVGGFAVSLTSQSPLVQ